MNRQTVGMSGDSTKSRVFTLARPAVVGAFLAWGTFAGGEESGDEVPPTPPTPPGLPEPLSKAHFADLMESSPFLRPLDLSKTLVLTGIAEIDGQLIATLNDREKEQTHVISGTAGPQGWRLVGIEGDQSKLETITAQISLAGREVVSVRFDQGQLVPKPESLPRVPPEQAQRIAEQAREFRRGISGDGFRGPPPPELVEKLSKLTEDTRGRLIYQISEMRNRGVSSEERQKAFVQMVDRALQGRR